MKISTVKIKNFRGYGECQDENSYGFFIFDDLDKSDFIIFNGFNGFGKTSFFEAIEWCLSNKIKRLEIFETYQDYKSELKSSHYLTFYIPNVERKAEVIIEFNNNYTVRRTTTAKSIIEDNYNSKTEFFINENKVENNTNLIGNCKVNDILNYNFIGQETIVDLLRRTKPSERSAHFLKLANQDIINVIEQKSSSKNLKFDAKIDKNNKQIAILRTSIEKANLFFSENNFKDINEYIQQINIAKSEFENISNKLKIEKGKEWINQQYTSSTITKENCFDFVDTSLNRIELAQNRILQFEKDKINKSEYNALLKIIELYSINEKLKYLKSFNVNQYLNQNKELNENIRLNEKTFSTTKTFQEFIQTHESNWNIFENVYSNVNTIIDNVDKTIDNYNTSKNQTEIFANGIFNNKEFNIESIISKDTFEIVRNLLNELIEKTKHVNTSDIQNIVLAHKRLLEEKKKEINENNKIKASLTELNSDYVNLLNEVKGYIINQNEIVECPVCLNTDFSIGFEKLKIENDENSLKNQLIILIDSNISKGNLKIKDFENQTTKINELINSSIKDIKAKLNEEFLNPIKNITELYNKIVSSVNNELLIKTKTIESIVTSTNKTLLSINEQLSKFKILYKEIYKIELQNFDNVNINEDANININNENIEKYKQTIKQKQVTTKEECIDYKNELNQIVVEDEIEIMEHKINDLNLILRHLKTFEQFKITENDKIQIITSLNAETEIEKLGKLNEQIRNDKKIIEAINQKIIQKKSSILDTIFDNKLIKQIYSEIEPHYRFKNLKLVKRPRGGKGLENYIQTEEFPINLDQIFSTAQINTLALSIFLGIGLPEKFSNFEQLFLDDPIQSMDDLNILALIDIFRALVNVKDAKRIIIATHDDNFAKLLKIKMRNYNIKTIDFNAYGDEGPLIEIN